MSVREDIIKAIISECQSAIAPIPIYRQPVVALNKDEAPALIINIDSESIVKNVNNITERILTLKFIACARDDINGWEIADSIICKVHKAIMEDQSINGLVLSIVSDDVDYTAEAADIEAISIPSVYKITYRTYTNDITRRI